MSRVPFKYSTLTTVLKDRQRKSIPQIIGESMAYGIVKREMPRQYFHSLLYRRHRGDVTTYLSRQEYWRLRSLVDRADQIPILRDKIKFQKFYSSVVGVRIPTCLGCIEDGHLLEEDGRSTRLLPGSGAEARLLSAARAAGARSVFVKPALDYGGRGILRLDDANVAGDPLAHLPPGSYIIQATIEQHETLNAIYSESVNTLRILVAMTEVDDAQVVCALLRIGSGGHFVDNSTSGGMFAPVDLRTGLVLAPCETFFANGAKIYDLHPDSLMRIEGNEIPWFSKTLKMACIASVALNYPLVGWDLAITPDGPVVIEGNDNADYHHAETACGPFAHNAHMRRLVMELNNGRWLW